MNHEDGLAAIRDFVRRADPLRPGERAGSVPGPPAVTALAAEIDAMVDRYERERRTAARRQLAEREHERRVIAHDLHSDVGQLLTAALLQLDNVARVGPATAPLEASRQATAQALETVQELSRRLRPLVLDDLGLAAALAALAASVTRRDGLRVRQTVDSEAAEAIDGLDAVVLLRVVQLHIAAVVDRGEAIAAEISLTAGSFGVELRMADDGRSAPDEPAMRELREWAVALGATVHVTAGPEGTILLVRIPGADGLGAPLPAEPPASTIEQ